MTTDHHDLERGLSPKLRRDPGVSISLPARQNPAPSLRLQADEDAPRSRTIRTEPTAKRAQLAKPSRSGSMSSPTPATLRTTSRRGSRPRRRNRTLGAANERAGPGPAPRRVPPQQIHPRLKRRVYNRLKAYTAQTGATDSAVVNAALAQYLDKSSDTALILRRLDRISRGQARAQREIEVLSEFLGAFIQLWFAHTPALARRAEGGPAIGYQALRGDDRVRSQAAQRTEALHGRPPRARGPDDEQRRQTRRRERERRWPCGNESEARRLEALRLQMRAIIPFLDDETVIEIALNADGEIWVERMGAPMVATGAVCRKTRPWSCSGSRRTPSAPRSRRQAFARRSHPRLEYPPAGDGPAGRRGARPSRSESHRPEVFTLDDYVPRGILSHRQADQIRRAVSDRDNILVGGATGSGKSTFTNAILQEIAAQTDRPPLHRRGHARAPVRGPQQAPDLRPRSPSTAGSAPSWMPCGPGPTAS